MRVHYWLLFPWGTGVIGVLYEQALAGRARAEIEHSDGGTTPLRVGDWLRLRPGDDSLIERCAGPTLDVGSGPGRLTVALAERGIPALGIDVTPHAVRMARAAGALTLLRDVFGRVPGTGRWMTVLLADGNIGIGGDPAALLGRMAELLAPPGQALVEVQPPGAELRLEKVRLRHGTQAGEWFPWAYVGVDQVAGLAAETGLFPAGTWSAHDRWFVALRRQPAPAQPDTAQPAPAQPEAAQPEAAQPDTARSEAAWPAAGSLAFDYGLPG